MRNSRQTVLAILLVISTHTSTIAGSRIWGFLGKRALSPDNTCGNVGAGSKNGYICNPALAQGGKCCSANGYCGNTEDYCGSDCQAAFGTCDSAATTTDMYVCGSSNNGVSCAENQCCSGNGYCGNTTDYCGTGCQATYGRCGSISSSGRSTASSLNPTSRPSVSSSTKATSQSTQATSSAKTGPTTSPGGGCGPQNGGYQCPSGQCCSPEGWCGTTSDYCADPDCQFEYGICDSDHTPAGASTANDPRPLLGSVTYTQDIIDCIQPKVVALTFDDGPYLYTNALLDVLQQFNFSATFFITGNNMGKGPIDTTAPYPAVIKRMVADGHQVASHTWSHYSLSNISSAMRIQQMVKNERAIANIIGKYPTYMRPPFSQCSQSSGCWADMLKLGYHRTYFDLDTQDYLNPLPSQIQNSKDIVKNYITGPGSVGSSDWLSIQHDIVQQSVTNLSTYYYNLIKSEGWKGVTVGECLNDPAKNWYRTPGASTSTSTSTSHLSSTTAHSTSTTLHSTSTTAHSTSTALHSTSTTVHSTSTTLHSTSTSLHSTSTSLHSSSTSLHSSSTTAHSTTSSASLKTTAAAADATSHSMSMSLSANVTGTGSRTANSTSTSGSMPSAQSNRNTSTSINASESVAKTASLTSTSPSEAELSRIASLSLSSSESVIKTTSSSTTTQPRSQPSPNLSSTITSSSATNTSTSCSLTTGLSTEGQLSHMSIYQGSSFLSNSTQPDPGSTDVTATKAIDTTPTDSSSSSTTSGPSIPTNAGFGYAYVGCFKDDQVYRAVSGSGYTNGVTVKGCAEYCHNQTAPIFSIEYYGECFCGQTLNSTLGRSTGCNYICNYNSSEICGGFYDAQVYSQNLTLGMNASGVGSSMSDDSTSLSQSPMTTKVGASTSFNASAIASTRNITITPQASTANASMSVGHISSSTLTPTGYLSAPGANPTNTSGIVSSTSLAVSSANHTNSSVASQSGLRTNTTILSTNTTALNPNATALHANTTSLRTNSTLLSTNGTAVRTNSTATATNTTTSVKPSPTSQCLVQMNGFCGSIESFTNVDGCWDSVTNCTKQNMACYGLASGNTEKSTCGNYTQKCISLFWYCRGCGSPCSSQSFISSLPLSRRRVTLIL